MNIDIGNECTECRRDTSFGNGLFVNRIPSSTDKLTGYLCPNCQLMECEMCGELSLDFGGYEAMVVCDECNPEYKDEEG